MGLGLLHSEGLKAGETTLKWKDKPAALIVTLQKLILTHLQLKNLLVTNQRMCQMHHYIHQHVLGF